MFQRSDSGLVVFLALVYVLLNFGYSLLRHYQVATDKHLIRRTLDAVLFVDLVPSLFLLIVLESVFGITLLVLAIAVRVALRQIIMNGGLWAIVLDVVILPLVMGITYTMSVFIYCGYL